MCEPKKPNYTDSEIKEMNLKLIEYNELIKNEKIV